MQNAEPIADALIALINSSPYSPRKDQIVALLRAHAETPATAPVPEVMVGGCLAGASLMVTVDSRIEAKGFSVVAKPGSNPSTDTILVAILDFLRDAVLTKKARPA